MVELGQEWGMYVVSFLKIKSPLYGGGSTHNSIN